MGCTVKSHVRTFRWARGSVVATVVGAWVIAGFPMLVAPVSAGGDDPEPGCTITGTGRADVLSGSAGDDVICGMGGNDRLVGGGGDDVLLGGGGADVLVGGPGDDLLRGGPGADVMQGGGDDDGLRGGPGDDTVAGGAGVDRMRGSAGGDELAGGSGRDVVIYMPRVAALRVSIGDGVANDGGRGEGDEIAADVEDVQGGMGNDTIIGSNAGNRLFGLGGNDRVVGGRGNDGLAGGAGTDVIDGRDGPGFVDDLSCGDGAGDRVLADMTDRIGAGCEDVVQNDPPTGISLTPAQVEENEPVGTTVGILSAADPDPGDSHRFTLVGGAGSTDNGSFTISGTQLRTGLVFDAESKDSYSIRVRATDTEGAFVEQQLTVTIVDANDPPVAVDDTFDTDEDTVLELPVAGVASPAGNDTDPESDPLTVTAVAGATGGTVTIVGGLIEFTPTLNLCGAAAGSFGYTVSDGNGGSDTGAVTVDIACVDDLPTAVDDTATVAEDDPATVVDVLANDVDAEDDPITIDTVTQPDHGTVTVAADEVSYEPAANYCNSDAGGSPDTFSYTINGGDTATVSVTVTCVDDLPVTFDDVATVAEDSGATAIPVLDNDTDVEKDPITITAASDPDHGTVAITGNGTGLTYAPDLEYCNDPPGTTPDVFTYTVNGGDTATVSVTVTCVNDAPVAVDDTATVVEDDPATTIDVLANDTDVDAGPKLVDSVTQPDNGTVVITNGGANLTYQPDPNYCNNPPGTTPDTFTYTLNGGSTATVSVTVTCVAEDPVAVNDAATVAEDSGASTVDVLGNDVDADSVGITIDAVTQPANGTVVITNSGNDLTYQPDPNYCNNPPGTTLDTFTYTIVPGGSTATVSVTVTCVDDAPVAVNDTATVNEDAAAAAIGVLANDTDVDGGTRTIASVTQPANGAAVITGGGTGLTYQPNANYCNNPPGTTPDTFTYTLNGGSTATVSVTVTCVNDAPVVTLSGSTPTFTENGPAVTVDGGVTVTDVDDTSLVSGTVSITVGVVAGDTLTFTPAGGIIDTNPAPAVLDLSGTTTITNWQSVLRSVQYSTASDNPTAATRTVSFTVNDGDVASNTATKQVTVVPVNDAPVLTQPDTTALGFTEGAAATVITPNLTASDVDSANLVGATVDLGTGYVNGQDVLSLGTNPQNNITAAFDPATGTLTLTGSSTVANYQAALRDVRFVNTSQDPTAGTRTISIQVADGTDSSNVVTRGVTVTPVNDAPDAVNDSFTGANGALANTRLAVGTTTTGPHLATTGGVLGNDTDVDSPTSGFTAGPATISSANCTSCGNVTLNSNGTFTYDPPAGFTGTDTFTYTLNDNDAQAPANLTDTASVSIEVVGPLVWYVDIDAANPPTGQGGRSHSPFNSLAPLTTGGTADGLDGNGDIIFVGVDSAAPITPYDGGIVLETNQRLWGEPFGLTVDPTGPIPSTVLVAPNPGTPVASNPNVRTTGGVGITLANGVDLQRVNAGVTGAAGTTGISGNAITTATIGANQLVQGNATGIALSGAAGGNITVDATITGNTGNAVDVANRTSGTVSFTGAVNGSATNVGAALTNNTGATIAFTGAVNLAGSGPAGTTFSATGGGTITANNAANQITSFTGTGVSLNGVTLGGAGVTLNSVNSSGAATNGILLTNVAGPGAFTVNGGAITATTRALDVDDNSPNITIGAALTTSGASARSVDVTNRDGGTVDINALVTDTSQGINLTTNGSGLIRFDGGINASTNTNTALNATGGGTIAVTDTNGATAPNNTLTTTTGTALNVTGTTIHADGLTFQSISAGTASSGPASGIVLSNTGSQQLLVMGTDGADAGTLPDAGTGGTIQNTTDDGVSLTGANSTSLGGVNITNTGGEGIDMDGGSGLTLTTVNITGAGNGDNEDGLDMVNVGGTVSIQGSSFVDAEEELIEIDNANTNLTVNVGTTTASTFTHGAVLGSFTGQAILYTGRGTSNLALNVSNSTFTNIRLFAIQVGGDNTWSGSNTNLNYLNNQFTTTITNTLGNPNNRANTLNTQGRGTVDIDALVQGNTISGGGGGGIQFGADESSNLNVEIRNNSVSTQFADGILVGVDESASITMLIDTNTITNTSSDGMEIANAIFPDGLNATLNVTVTNNTVTGHNNNAGANAFFGGIAIFGGANAGDNTFVNVTGNNVSGNPNPGTFFDYAVDGSSFGDPITVQGPGTAAVTETDFLAAPPPQNTSGSPAGGRTFIGNAFYSNGATVPLPVLTP